MKNVRKLLMVVFLMLSSVILAEEWDYYSDPGTSTSGNWMASSFIYHDTTVKRIVSPFFAIETTHLNDISLGENSDFKPGDKGIKRWNQYIKPCSSRTN